MSNVEQTPPIRPPERGQRSGCATAIMLVVGVILLIPGVLCAILNAKMGAGAGGDPITMFVMMAALGGLGLIVFAITRK
ncbi:MULTISPECIES: hypothetical protein [Bradyrhizobium]|jgi:hypothetical protein|uniref:hypothetical protein n=1 Tax=Bradyrhizobium TaxID=374 RepID=UPI0004829007|nr:MULTISPECIES: hypothetical protein [Bradyrhizobium]MCS3444849.1 hypothetical protein [Bradyrhizobium elkanii]MCS3564023.1 hypothetical protein [Bradyrhizobium elkanii]MCW2146145.1 hypothetical protein [Bradyrhizobium elkanii]MCW2354782.1 hypothetical protein [Bradyrhizobium elkanii]MCW2378972.1 hypothetical protein [Bradyrhizobium elkanii]